MEQQRSRVLSINIIAGMEDSRGSELDFLNGRWERAQEAKVRRRRSLQASLVKCADLDKQVKKLLDSVTATQLEIISGATDKQVSSGGNISNVKVLLYFVECLNSFSNIHIQWFYSHVFVFYFIYFILCILF